MRCILGCLILLVLTACQPAANNSEQVLETIQGRTMGTTYTVKWIGVEGSPSGTQMQTEVDAALIEVNRQMSTYDPDSELSKFNQAAAGQGVDVSTGVITVLNEAIRLAQLTDGVLDVTVGPLVNLWGFGPQARPETVPSDALIQATRAATGIEHLRIDGRQLSKDIDGLYVDLSTIAKGYGVDVVAELLEAYGIANYLVEIGGEMRLSGKKPADQAWNIAIEKPVSMERAVQQIVSIGDNAIATSGDYRNYYERDGQRFSHLIDPRNGKPITHNLVSVTVVHPSSMTADGLATALNVMGFEQAKTFALQHQLPVLLIKRENGEFTTYNTPQFEPFLRD